MAVVLELVRHRQPKQMSRRCIAFNHRFGHEVKIIRHPIAQQDVLCMLDFSPFLACRLKVFFELPGMLQDAWYHLRRLGGNTTVLLPVANSGVAFDEPGADRPRHIRLCSITKR